MKAARWIGGDVWCARTHRYRRSRTARSWSGPPMRPSAAPTFTLCSLTRRRSPGPPATPGTRARARWRSRCPGFEPGDCVLTVPHAAAGRCLAEFQSLRGSACIRLPAAARLNHLLMAQQLGTVVYALRCNPLDLIGKDAVVIGQGSAGAFFTFLRKRAGAARVLVSDKSPARLAYARQLGADMAVEAGAVDFRSAVLEATGGQDASVVVEAVGSRETFPLSLELAAAGATVVWFGLPEGVGDYMFSFNEFFPRRLTAYSTFGAQGEPGHESFRYAVRMIADGAIDVAPLLSHMLPIEEIDEAFRVAHERTDNALKVSIKF
jgi:L-iditol 2-dehydrogenase